MDELDLIRQLDAGSEAVPAARARARARLDTAIAAERAPRRGRAGLSPARRWVAVAAVATLAGAAGFALLGQRPVRPRPDLVVEAQVRYPNDTAADVVAHSDHVVLATAVAETEVADDAPAARRAAGEGEVYRRVTFRVDRTLWSRAGAPAAPSELTSVWWGWVLHDHQRTRFVPHGAPWVEVGSRYVLPVAQDEGRFAAVQPLAVFRFDGTAVVLGEGQDTPLAQRLAGASERAVADVFAAAARAG